MADYFVADRFFAGLGTASLSGATVKSGSAGKTGCHMMRGRAMRQNTLREDNGEEYGSAAHAV